MRTLDKLVRRIGLALTLAIGLTTAACTGSMVPLGSAGGGGDDDAIVPPPGNQPSAAETTFNTDVKPLLSACAGCHAGAPPLGFLGSAGESGYYDAIVASTVIDKTTPASSKLIVHTHASPAAELDATGKQSVETWIQQEAGL